jgi:hypothetical protein
MHRSTSKWAISVQDEGQDVTSVTLCPNREIFENFLHLVVESGNIR